MNTSNKAALAGLGEDAEVYLGILNEGLCELKQAISDTDRQTLLAFIKLIQKWNKAYNLTAIKQGAEMVRLHLLDSLAILPHLQGKRVIDIGTGAGLPGIPLAICMPDVQFVLLDSNSKKTRFVQQAVLELKLKNVSVQHNRVEDYQPEELFDCVLTRAFASLPDIIEKTSHLLAKNGVLLAMKGQAPLSELESLAEKFTVLPINVPGIDAERCLVRIELFNEV